MSEEEMAQLADYLERRKDEIAHRAHAERRSKRQLVVRIGAFVVVVSVVSGAGLLLHYEVLYKGAEFVITSITDRIITQIMEA
jgi:hypothetical protein